MTKSIGLIGVGLLGTAMAERLLAEGFQVNGFDPSAAQRDQLARLGGRAAGSAREIAATNRRILLSLPNSDVSETVLGEIESACTPGTIIIDTTTGDPRRIEAFGPRLEEREIGFLDATVGGSSREARARDVIVMAGGRAQDFEKCRDIFDCFARASYLVGPWGSGARMKLVTNLVLGLHRAVLAEALGFAASSGLDSAQTLEILKSSSSYSRVMDIKGEKMLTGDFRPDARLAQHGKDVRLILVNGQETGARLPLSELHLRLLTELEEQGQGEADNSAILLAFQPPASASQ